MFCFCPREEKNIKVWVQVLRVCYYMCKISSIKPFVAPEESVGV